MNVGVVGLGNMGKHHLRVYSELRWVDNIFVYDIDPKQAKITKETYPEITICHSINDVIKNV
ncbi:MAG: Gfo/Idh/MocA family protein, partial [Candidatus Odinarchaeia archaeon]